MNLQKLRLGQLKPADGATTVGDTHFAKVTALFNFDGSDGDTTTSGLDSSNKNLTVSYSSGDQLSNTQKKFGATSLYVADNVTLSSSDGFNMGTGDFTIEAWYYLTQYNNHFLYDQYAGSSTGVGNNQIYVKSTEGGSIRIYYDGNSKFTTTGAISLNTWTHVALVRYSNTIKVYFNGTADATTQSYSGQFGKTGTVYLGDQHSGGGGAPAYYIDDLRVTKGLARYTSNFTAPTTTHLTSAGDSFKQIIVNEDADGVIVGTNGINASRIAKAWCNFDGTGTPAIRGSYNCSSISDIGTGSYKVNFSTGMSDEGNYVAFCAGAEVNSGSSQNHLFHLKRETPTSDILNEDFVHVASANTSATQTDDGLFCVLVFGN